MRESIPHDSRWYPIFVRYLAALDEIIIVLGGDPTKVYPSSTGIWQGASRSGTKPMPRGVVGKIEGLIFDHFGDFEGFILETEEDERIHFFSREDHVRQVAEGAWQTRLRVTVIPEENDDHRLRRIVLHRAPHPL
jgi:hypothetical protein